MSTLASLPNVAFILQVKVTFDPKDRGEFLKHVKIAFEHVKKKPEIVNFVIGEDMQQPGTFEWTGGWSKDVQWFMTNQISKDYYKPYLEATEPLFTAPRVSSVSTP